MLGNILISLRATLATWIVLSATALVVLVLGVGAAATSRVLDATAAQIEAEADYTGGFARAIATLWAGG